MDVGPFEKGIFTFYQSTKKVTRRFEGTPECIALAGFVTAKIRSLVAECNVQLANITFQ
jgi:hypothetical protein